MRGTPKLCKRSGSPYWYITLSEGRRSKRYSTGTSNRAQAERVLAQYLLERQKPGLISEDEIKVNDMLDRYCESSESSVIYYHLKHLKPYFANHSISAINNQAIRGYIKNRSSQKAIRGREKSDRNVSTSTIRRELDTLSAAINFARREGHIKDVPYIEKPKASAPRERWLTYEEAGKLLAAAKENARLLAFIEIAMNTGARPSSILELKWFQVDFENRLIHFNPEGRAQTHKHRPTVFINDSLFKSLSLMKKKSEYVLGGVKSIKHAFRNACDRVGLQGVTPYTLRHTAITWAVRDGHSLALAGQLAGHKDPRTTMRYAKHDPSFTENITSSLSTGALLAHNLSKNVDIAKKSGNKNKEKQ